LPYSSSFSNFSKKLLRVDAFSPERLIAFRLMKE
jgi:hypothetical protein